VQNTIFVGLDVHKATISVAIAGGERGVKVRHWGTINNRRSRPQAVVPQCVV
jgi:hypothetical protein